MMELSGVSVWRQAESRVGSECYKYALFTSLLL